MPLTRPCEISDCISLSDKLGREMGAFVSENGAVDAPLSAIVDELSPNKEGICISGAQDDMLSRPDKLASFPAVSVVVAGVVSFIEFEAGNIAVLR